jgi:hypothetical protein
MSLCTAILVSAGLAEEPAALIAHGGVCEGGGFGHVRPTFLYSESTIRLLK